jgi:hypothetical protein
MGRLPPQLIDGRPQREGRLARVLHVCGPMQGFVNGPLQVVLVQQGQESQQGPAPQFVTIDRATAVVQVGPLVDDAGQGVMDLGFEIAGIPKVVPPFGFSLILGS